LLSALTFPELTPPVTLEPWNEFELPLLEFALALTKINKGNIAGKWILGKLAENILKNL
jgi:hypothetical protein